jgi:capsular polysaccharide transport system permease protein
MLKRTDQFSDRALAPSEIPEHRRFWPRRLLEKFFGLGWLFILSVLVPTTLALLYFGVFASDVYVSEARFVVRSPDKPTTSGLGILLKTAGFSNAGDEIYAAQDYVISRDALQAINRDGAFVRSYSDPSISIFDRFNPLGSGGTFEDLFEYYQSKVKVDHETTSSITTLTVRAYTPQAAHFFNEKLLEMAEGTVNRLNERGREDLIRFATTEVSDAKQKARNAALALSAYRNREGVVDPEKQATTQLQMISKLQDGLIASKTQLLQLRAFAPDNPQIEVLETRVKGLSQEIDQQFGMVAGDRKSLAATAAQYQRLLVESQFADKNMAAAMASLQDAMNEARRKQAYVERIVQPNLPDEAIEPRRFRAILATFVFSIIVWGVLSMLFAGVREHQQ